MLGFFTSIQTTFKLVWYLKTDPKLYLRNRGTLGFSICQATYLALISNLSSSNQLLYSLVTILYLLGPWQYRSPIPLIGSNRLPLQHHHGNGTMLNMAETPKFYATIITYAYVIYSILL